MSDITVSVTAQPAITVGVSAVGAQGPEGPAGPVAVSADDGNIAILGSDDLIYVPESGGGGAVDSVAGKTGDVVLVKADVGLGNVDNTADADKPVSTATATALAGKSDTGHTHAQGDVAGLAAALAGKSDTGHTHTASNVTDFNTAADARVSAGITGKADLASPVFTGNPTAPTPAAGDNDTSIATTAFVRATLGQYVAVNAQTGTTYTPALTDVGALVTLSNTSAITVTLPQDSSVAFPIGSRVDFAGINTGLVTFAAGTGATVNATPSLVTRARYSAVTAIKVAANTWLVVGDLT